MKKIVVIFFAVVLFVSCVTHISSSDLSQLTTGMSKAQVIARIGRPQRVLAVNDTRDGFQEILQFRLARNEIYAFEFWNDNLTGIEFLHQNVTYIPHIAPPFWYPAFGRPIVIINNRPPFNNRPNRPSPNQPNRPSPNQPNRPSPNQPNRPSRPETSRPQTNTPTTRPSVVSPPPANVPTTRPSTPSTGSGTTSRPVR